MLMLSSPLIDNGKAQAISHWPHTRTLKWCVHFSFVRSLSICRADACRKHNRSAFMCSLTEWWAYCVVLSFRVVHVFVCVSTHQHTGEGQWRRAAWFNSGAEHEKTFPSMTSIALCAQHGMRAACDALFTWMWPDNRRAFAVSCCNVERRARCANSRTLYTTSHDATRKWNVFGYVYSMPIATTTRIHFGTQRRHHLIEYFFFFFFFCFVFIFLFFALF